ncbi:DUF2637 domain-containing protein [Kitasatospora sp. NPDC048298]|uniref:DUF2637 domain-containing protein n=1 Tax=Kitasatospora sp. NPDC048298 TaxID=3364049 RepID=UPI0037177288
MNRTIEYDPSTEVHTPAHPGAQEVPTPRTEAHTDEQIPLTLLIALIAGASAVAAVAMAASSFTLAALGTAIGWTQWRGWLAWALPISVDLLAAVAGVAWLAKGVPEQARRLARTITLVAVGTSVLLNAVSHLVESGDVHVGPWLRISVSTVPPIVAAVGLHLIVTVVRTSSGRRTAPAPRRGRKRRRAERREAAQAPAQVMPVVLSKPEARPKPVPVVPAAIEQPPAAEAEPEVVTGTYATDWIANGTGTWQPDPSVYAASYPEAEIEEDQAAEPEQPQPPVDRWLKSVSDEVRTQVHTDVHTSSDQPVDAEDSQDEADDQEEPETTGEMTAEQRRQIILTAISEGKSQRATAALASCSPTYVRKVIAGEAA